jgi:alpha-mannosidase
MLMLIWVSESSWSKNLQHTNSIGRHHIRYSIFPHVGPLDHRTIRAGYNINNPLKLHRHPSPATIAPVLSSFKIEGAPGIILDTVKRGEDDEDVTNTDGIVPRKGRSIIVRVYDALGGKSTGTLKWGKIPVKSVYSTNLLEDDGTELDISDSGDGVEITVRPFEVATYRLQL